MSAEDPYDDDTPRGKCKNCRKGIVLVDWAKGLCDDCFIIAEPDKPARDEEVTELKNPPWLTWSEDTNPVA